MLRSLTVRDFAIVDALTLDFTSGFSVMTGETGAGKSILIDAIQLVLGGRGDATMVREGAKRADITAEFSLNKSVIAWLSSHAIDSEDDMLLLHRIIDASSGRSRCFINGIAVTVIQLRNLGALLVDIHGQHAHQLLMKAGEQRSLLDRHAGLEQKVAELEERFREWHVLEQKVVEARTNTERLQEEYGRLEWQIGEFEKVQPQVGEWEQVNQDFDRLSHAVSLLEGIGSAVNELSEEDHSIISKLGSMVRTLTGLAHIDKELEPAVELLESSRIQLQEVIYTLRDYLVHTELDPSQLQVVGQRMEALHALARQFRIQPEFLPEELERRRHQLAQLKQDNNLETLEKQASQAKAAYKTLAEDVSNKRHQTGQVLGEAVTAIMQELHMSGGCFSVDIQEQKPGSYGVDAVEFLVAGHEGGALRPLTKVASGGELARISLALSVIASDATATPTLVFDEVDSGVGGSVAEMVGQLLKRLSNNHQVLCVTHLPQVASYAQQHFQVSKQTVAGITHPVSRITHLSGEERVIEIARMLSGTELSETVLNHAREMLEQSIFRLT